MLKPATGEPPAQETLADLREEIDRIDSAMHRLLMERGEIIDRLISVKSKQGGGSAFRPSREADMMRRLVERHAGLLPLDTVETIWRIIISTFTYVQSNYTVHADVSDGDTVMRDCCRFHFGFTVPFETHQGIGSVIEAVKTSNGDLGLLRIQAGPSAGAWWTQLAAPDAPKVIARLPFVERPDHPAGLPLFVVATPPADATARDVVILSVGIDQWQDDLPARLAEQNIEILDKSVTCKPFSLMLAASHKECAEVPAHAIDERLRGAFHDRGIDAQVTEIGSHAARYDLASDCREAAQ
jgi:chorismate mutase